MKNEQNKTAKQKNTLQECEKQRDEYLAGWQRAKADFENYKKGETERIQQVLKYAVEEQILNILPILDNFQLVEQNMPKNLKDNEYIKGALQIKIQMENFLKNQEVKEIKTIGEKFDPNFHEITEQVNNKNKESGIIAEEIQKGYMLESKVLRPARVKVVK